MSPNTFHLAVWLDHQAAHLYRVTRKGAEEVAVIHAPDQGRGHVHHKAGTNGSGHVGMDKDFLRKISDLLQEGREILIVGPADAKHALKAHLDNERPLLAARVIGVRAMPRAGAGEIHDLAQQLFRHADRMTSRP